MKRVDINRLNIRLKGVSAAVGKTAVSNLDRTLPAYLANLQPGKGIVRITAVNPSPIHLPRHTPAADINHRIAQAIAQAIIARQAEQEKRQP